MIDILQGLTGGGLPFLFAWVLPSAIALSAFGLLVFPSVDHLPVLREIAAMSGPSQALVMAFAAVTIALVLSASDTPIYRLLEGYSWPSRLQDWGAARQKQRRDELKKELGNTTPGWRQDLWAERLERFPTSEDLAPTALGNSLRAFETYGLDHYNMNTQLLWAELYSSVTDDLRAEYERSRAAVDFFVALLYLSGLFGLVALISGLGTAQFRLLIASAIAFALMPVSYRLATADTSYWARTTRAMVDMGRRELAARLNLRIPDTTEEERRMWGVVNAFVYYPYEEAGGKALDEFRIKGS
jgi:hypothetical protein